MVAIIGCEHREVKYEPTDTEAVESVRLMEDAEVGATAWETLEAARMIDDGWDS